MSTKLFFLLAITFYTAVTAVLMILFQASMLVTTVVLIGAPVVILWNRVFINSHLVPILAVFTLLGSAMVQLFAYKSGLWYELSPLSWQIFGGAPVEAYLFAVLNVLYFILLYEYIFDDNKNTGATKVQSRVIAILGVIYALAISYLTLESTILVRYPFVCLIGAISGVGALFMAFRKQVPSLRIFTKAANFAFMTLPLSLVYEWVMLENGIRIFANLNDYIYYFSWGGMILPIEEIVLLLIIPFGLVVIYELYFDDGK